MVIKRLFVFCFLACPVQLKLSENHLAYEANMQKKCKLGHLGSKGTNFIVWKPGLGGTLNFRNYQHRPEESDLVTYIGRVRKKET